MVEVVEDGPSGQTVDAEAGLLRDVLEAGQWIGRSEEGGRDEVAREDTLGIAAEGHVRHVQEPPGP